LSPFFLSCNFFRIPAVGSVGERHHVDADPDTAYYFDADPDSAYHFDADPDMDASVLQTDQKDAEKWRTYFLRKNDPTLYIN
jgi:hypothetical protein